MYLPFHGPLITVGKSGIKKNFLMTIQDELKYGEKVIENNKQTKYRFRRVKIANFLILGTYLYK